MTKFKRWPIGFQSGPTANPRGIGEVINDMAGHGIAFFSAAADDTKILMDLQESQRKTGVPHKGNFIITELKVEHNYNVSVPPGWPKMKEPSEELAKEHWDFVQARQLDGDPYLPPEFDFKDLNCIWVSTWNEIVFYRGWGSAGDEASWDEPFSNFTGYADYIGAHAVEIGKEAVRRKLRWAAFGFAGGNPEEGAWEEPGMLAYLKLCHDNHDRLGIALHEYSFKDDLNSPFIGRFKQLHDVCDKYGLRRPVIQIKEFGWRKDRVPPKDVALEQVRKAADIYMEHPNIHGVAMWTLMKSGKADWGDAHETLKSMIRPIGDLAKANAKPIPEEKVPDGSVQPTRRPKAGRPAPAARVHGNSALNNGWKPSQPLNTIQAGQEFQVTWNFENNGYTTWDSRTQLVYCEPGHPQTAHVPTSPMGAQKSYSISSIGAPAQVLPGEQVSLTVHFKAPMANGDHGTSWQLRAADGSTFGEMRWARPTISGATTATQPQTQPTVQPSTQPGPVEPTEPVSPLVVEPNVIRVALPDGLPVMMGKSKSGAVEINVPDGFSVKLE